MQFCETLLVEHPEKIKNPAPLHKAILHCSTYSNTSMRRKCLTVLNRIVGNLSGAVIARALFKELQNFLDSNKVIAKSEDQKENDNSCISPHALIECIISLCSSSGLTVEDAHLLAIEALLPTHHPSVVALAPNLWVNIVKHLNCKPKDLLAQRASHFRSSLIEGYNNTFVSR